MEVQDSTSLVLGQCLNTHSPPPLQLPPSSRDLRRCQKDVIHNSGRSYISDGKCVFCLSNMGQMTVPIRHQLAPTCPILAGCARAEQSRGWALSSFPRCAASPCGSGQQHSWHGDARARVCALCSFCTGTDVCGFQSCQSCTLHKH